eukprot:CAMPEP_0182488274 /NCGR_PEP_ID=MMETSP1319-20130603/48326_1 /TAXON_ID=172717 /ORGANISM="Bolidomonas pacifica, Strain RCC208" /LENGTH=254 /DNA_ID=CAMNT_0024690401 /DNA_START=509 /DNA_END=1273 /DNA_ORIENTATION=-
MASAGAGYDLSPTTFSPDGRIFQVSYAQKSVSTSGTSLGILCSDGVVLACEKLKNSKMLLPSSGRRLHSVGAGYACAVTGFASDGRQIVNRAREEVSSYKDTYGILPPPSVLADRLGHYVHYFTLHGALRPFGATATVASYDSDMKECKLHQIDPSGTCHSYYACAAGKGRQGAKTELEKLDLTTLTVEQAIKEAARIVLTTRDEKDKDMELEIATLAEGDKYQFKMCGKEVVSEALKWAGEQLEEDMEEDDDE